MQRWVIALMLIGACKGKSEDAAPAPTPATPATPAQPPPANTAHAEVGPHPDFPTAGRAGTDTIFSLEDPDRGPAAPRSIAIPRDLAWTVHAHCVDDPVALACSPADARARSGRHWRVGRAARTIVADVMVGGRVDERHVYVTKADGTPAQHVDIDAYGDVEAAWMFTTPGRYSARDRNGANTLAGCGSMAYTLDAAQRIAELRCLQWLGEPMHDTTGVVSRRYVRDARGFVVEEHRLGADGAPIVATDGVATLLLERDDAGRLRVRRHRDPSGASVMDDDGCHGWRYDYDASGARVRESCLGADDEPVRAISGIAITAYTYDARGCRTGVHYHAPDETRATDHDGVHGASEVREPVFCGLATHTCVDRARRPMSCGAGAPARTVYKRDPHGYPISEQHHDADGEPSGDGTYGAFELRRAYDALGNEVRMSCWSAAGRPIECASTGFHATVGTFDDAGRQLTRTFLDTTGQPATNLGVATARYQYDNYDHLFEAKNLDAGGALVDSYGSAIRRELYDAAHRRFAVLLFAVDGTPARYRACFTNATCPKQPWHAARIVRRGDGTVEKNLFFDADGQLIATQLCAGVPCFR